MHFIHSYGMDVQYVFIFSINTIKLFYIIIMCLYRLFSRYDLILMGLFNIVNWFMVSNIHSNC